jgi:hypothetical protein
MSIIEKQTTLGRSIADINTNIFKELVSLQRENIETYFATNQTFSEKLPEVTDISTFVALQREYGEALWNNAKTAVEAQNGIVRHAFEDARDAVKVAFNSESDTDEDTVEAVEPAVVEEPVAEVQAEETTQVAA